MNIRVVALVAWGGCVIGACTSSSDVTQVDGGGVDATSPPVDAAADTTASDVAAPDAARDASDAAAGDASAGDAAGEAEAAVDAGPLGSQTNPAASCKALLASAPSTPSGAYWISPSGALADAFQTYCDMTTEGGGWTKVTVAVSDADVRALLGASGRQMVKCTDNGTPYVASPSFAIAAPDAGADAGVAWSWDAGHFVQVGGTWRVNQADQACGTNPEYTSVTCATWWGVGCGNGGGIQNKLFPGVLDQPSAGYCADTTSAHTNAAFSICTASNGPDNYRTYSVFVRAD